MAAGPEFDLSVKFCIASVGELFEYATNKAFGIGYDLFENKCPSAWRTSCGEATWIELLGHSGWWPRQMEVMVASPASLRSMYFFASMHDSVSAGRLGLCNSKKCVAYQTDLNNYVTRHATKDCSCEELCVDASSLDAVVTTGALALLRIREAETLDGLAVEPVPLSLILGTLLYRMFGRMDWEMSKPMHYLGVSYSSLGNTHRALRRS